MHDQESYETKVLQSLKMRLLVLQLKVLDEERELIEKELRKSVIVEALSSIFFTLLCSLGIILFSSIVFLSIPFLKFK